MAIDAVILATAPHPEGLLLTLGARPTEGQCAADGTPYTNPASTPGQSTLVVVNPSWTPHVGDQIWGGSGLVTVESGGISFPYRREGYGRIYEAWPRVAQA